MKRLLPLFLFVTACDGKHSPAADEPGPAEVNVALSAAAPAEGDEAAMRANALPALRAAAGGKAAEIRSIRVGAMGAICGTVALAPPSDAEALPFILLASGEAMISATASIAYDDPENEFADQWIVNCATSEELSALEDQVIPNTNLATPVDLSNLTEAPAGGDAEEVAEPVVQKSQPAPPADVDSFARSIQRPAPEE